MADDALVIAAKRDLGYFKSILGLNSDRPAATGQPCAICGSSDALEYGPDQKRLGQFFFKCYSCGAGGDVVSAINAMLKTGWADAFKKIKSDWAGRAVPQSAHDEYHEQNLRALANGHAGKQQNLLPPPAVSKNHGIDKPEPVLDMERAEDVVRTNHDYLMHNLHLIQKWERGISQAVIEKYRIGFMEWGKVQFYPWGKKMDIPAAWVLPITDADGILKGVKLHFEERPHWGSKECPKALWYPLGTQPPPRQETVNGKNVNYGSNHAYYGMWPHPDTLQQPMGDDFSLDASYYIERMPAQFRDEWQMLCEAMKYKVADEQSKTVDALESYEIADAQMRAFDEIKSKVLKAVVKTENERASGSHKDQSDWSQYTYVCPGELKALSGESMGLMCTAPTGGESWMPGSKILSRLAGQKVCLIGDDDAPRRNLDKADPTVVKSIKCPGREWVNKWTQALYAHGSPQVLVKYGGRQEKTCD